MKKIFFLTVLLFIMIGCDEKVTEVTVEDTNEDGIYHVAPGDELLGNVEFFMMPWTVQGSAILLINGPGSNVGYDIRKRDDNAFIYFADSYISSGGNSFQSGTQLPYNEWLRVRLVVYKSGLAGWVVSFLQGLGLDFFDSLADYMIEEIYEVDVRLSLEKDRRIKISEWRGVTQKYKN